MELSPTLRAHLDVLEPYLEDLSVSEILVAGPDRVFVTRCGRSSPVEIAMSEARVRSMADRLLRAMGSRGRPERHEVQTGKISADLHVTVIGAPRGARCPLVRVLRRQTTSRTLEEILGADQLAGEVEAILLDTPMQQRAVLFSGPHGAPRLDLVVAMAGAWKRVGRVLVLEGEQGPLDRAGIGDLVLELDVGVEAIRAVAPDVVVAFDPSPSTWSDLLHVGRPIVASVEAPDGDIALSRVTALLLAGSSDLSRAAAEALVEAGVASVVELSRAPGESAIGRVGRPWFNGQRLEFKSLTRADSKILPTPALAEQAPQALKTPDPEALRRSLPRMDTGEFVDAELNELLPEDLVSKSFVHRLEDGLVIVDDGSSSTKNVEVLLRMPEPPPADDTPVFGVPASNVAVDTELEDNTQFGREEEFQRASSMAIPSQQTAPDAPGAEAIGDKREGHAPLALDPAQTLAGGEVLAAFDDAVEAVEAVEAEVGGKNAVPLEAAADRTKRVPNERTPTEIGGDLPGEPKPGTEAWASDAYEAALQIGEVTVPAEDEEPMSPFDPFDDQDVMTSAGLAPVTLDPFEFRGGRVDDTGGLADRTVGPEQGVTMGPPSAMDVYDSRVDPAQVAALDENEWDADGPSVIIDGPPVVGGYGVAPKPGDDPDRTRAGSFTRPLNNLEDEETPRRIRKSRRPPTDKRNGPANGSEGKNGASAASSEEDDDDARKNVRRRPPGRLLD